MNPQLSSRARRLANALLEIHRELCRGRGFKPDDITDATVEERTITYKRLFQRVDGSFHRSNVGAPLAEIAVWCAHRDLPPLHSLVVTSSTGRPGHNYTGAAGECSSREWSKHVRDCIACDHYPDSIPE